MISENYVYTILSVDDEPDISDLLTHILGNDYRVVSTTNADDAIEILRKDSIDIALLDIRMPGIDGFELCKKIKSDPLLRVIPVIFVSAYHSPEDIKKGYQLNANDFIYKPFIKEEVQAKIKVHLKYGELLKIEDISQTSGAE
jgi:CheY-like chemotaxis protein